MNNPSKNDSHSPKKDKLIEKALRIGGYSFPQTIDEVLEFERLFGTTDIILPPELQDPVFLYSILGSPAETKIPIDLKSTFSMAAREGSSELPEEIIMKIIHDIKIEESKNNDSAIEH